MRVEAPLSVDLAKEVVTVALKLAGPYPGNVEKRLSAPWARQTHAPKRRVGEDHVRSDGCLGGQTLAQSAQPLEELGIVPIEPLRCPR